MTSRRHFLNRSMVTFAGITLLGKKAFSITDTFTEKEEKKQSMLCAFSKPFDFLKDNMFRLLADAGFQGIDLTVREGGFVSPGNVEKELHHAINTAHKTGLSVPMIATGITDGKDAGSIRILKAASETGVKHYRTGYFYYDDKISTIQNLEIFREKLLRLAEINEKYNIQACYQNHVGNMFGSSLWDLWFLIKDFDPRLIGSQYDIRHAVVEGFTAWQSALKTISDHIGTICIKDFIYEKSNDKWQVRSVPLGTGVVDFGKFSDILREKNIQAPMTIHYEFPLLAKEEQSLPDKEKMKKMQPLIRKELDYLKSVSQSRPEHP